MNTYTRIALGFLFGMALFAGEPFSDTPQEALGEHDFNPPHRVQNLHPFMSGSSFANSVP
jgi:hypothetical protein